MIISSEPLEQVRALRTNDNPCTSTNEGLDFERCSALHNAIVKHAWISYGYDLTEMPEVTIWSLPSTQENLTELQDRLHPSVQEFLKRSLVPQSFPHPNNGTNHFFYFLGGLTGHGTLWDMTEQFDENHLGIYWTGSDFSSTLTGITYDQSDHTCIYNGESSMNPMTLSTWYRLETLLSTYISLIERGKIVALHHSIIRPWERIKLAGGGTVSRDKHPDPPPLQDPVTGARRTCPSRDPWVLVPYAKQDLRDALDAWHDLINTINEKAPEPLEAPFDGQGLYSEEVLLSAGIRTDSFGWEFLRNAQKPVLTHLGPGLRLVTATELVENAFMTSQGNIDPENGRLNVPVPILVGETEAANWLGHLFSDVEKIPYGLYLDLCHVDSDFPVEDGSRLVLPYPIGANGIATTADGQKIRKRNPHSHAELYQLGAHPWMPSHSSQLYAILDAFCRHVSSGDWRVGSQGVEEPCTVFKDADSPVATDGDSLNESGYTVPMH